MSLRASGVFEGTGLQLMVISVCSKFLNSEQETKTSKSKWDLNMALYTVLAQGSCETLVI